MRINNLLITCTLLVLAASSCVSTQKYNEMESARDHYKAQFESNKVVEAENDECQRKLRVADSQLLKLNNILTQEKLEKDKIAEAKLLLEKRYDETTNENAKLLTEYSATRSVMEEQLANVEDELYLRDRQLRGMEDQIGVTTHDLQSREERVAELELWDGIIVALPAAFFCIFVGNWSDYHGRKALLILLVYGRQIIVS